MNVLEWKCWSMWRFSLWNKQDLQLKGCLHHYTLKSQSIISFSINGAVTAVIVTYAVCSYIIVSGGFSLLFSLHSRDLTKTAGCSDELCSLTEVSVSLCWDFSESLNYAAKDDEISILCSFILFLIKHVDHQEWDFHHESLGSRLANTAGRNCHCCWPKRGSREGDGMLAGREREERREGGGGTLNVGTM